jgi:hypothetical protein
MNLRASWPARAVAVATIGYSTAMTIAPKVLAKPCGLTRPDGSVPEEVAGLVRSLGVRDVALAVALALAPAGYPLRLLTAARVISDGADAIWFSRLVRDKSMKRKVAGVAGGWALLEALAGLPGQAAGA